MFLKHADYCFSSMLIFAGFIKKKKNDTVVQFALPYNGGDPQ